MRENESLKYNNNSNYIKTNKDDINSFEILEKVNMNNIKLNEEGNNDNNDNNYYNNNYNFFSPLNMAGIYMMNGQNSFFDKLFMTLERINYQMYHLCEMLKLIKNQKANLKFFKSLIISAFKAIKQKFYDTIYMVKEYFLNFEENKNIEVQINSFLKLFKDKFSEELPQYNSKNIMNDIIINLMNMIYKENDANKNILELFFGDKNLIKKNTLEKLFSLSLDELKDLNDSKKLYFYSFPKIIIINDNNSAVNSLELFSYQYLNDYELISCIQKTESGFTSIIIKGEEYKKYIYQKDEKKYMVSNVPSIPNINLQDKKNKSMISIFKRNTKIQKKEYEVLSGMTMVGIKINDILPKSEH